MIQAGHKAQVQWGDGNWIFLDIGFASTKKTCGLIFGNAKPECVRFGDAKRQIVTQISKSDSTVNLVIEAPLSVCFDQRGNPKGRAIETQRSATRYWYSGPGPAVMVAAMYLIREITDAKADAPILLFEGFVSYKSDLTPSTHESDVCSLRDVVREPVKFSELIRPAETLAATTDFLCSAFRVAGLDFGVPAVIIGQRG
jgi:hypothetical protein